jgi:hypothetical protein
MEWTYGLVRDGIDTGNYIFFDDSNSLGRESEVINSRRRFFFTID